jgi:tRNA pseudouridine13 synthase
MYLIKQKPEDFIVNEITNLDLKENGLYSIFLLKKTNYTTEAAIQKIAQKLNIPRKAIGYAGNKDKIAITTQYISIKDINIKELELKDISLELKGYLDSPISLGNLEGNEFEIVVITKDKPKKIEKMINYFGEQRFSNNNKDIGYAILKKDFKKAAELILKNTGEQEYQLKERLSKNPTDFVGALRQIPMKILTLYINSYQSYLWNRMAEQEAKPNKPKKISLIGFGTKLDKESEKILKEEQLTTRDFIIRQIPELTQEGHNRDLFADIKDLVIEKIEEGYKIKFKLPKGAYATEAIKQIFTS